MGDKSYRKKIKVNEEQKNNQKVEKKIEKWQTGAKKLLFTRNLSYLDNDKESNIDTNYNQNIIKWGKRKHPASDSVLGSIVPHFFILNFCQSHDSRWYYCN